METNIPSRWKNTEGRERLVLKVDGGDELYRLLCEIFKVREG